jgi:hypothetical protein
MYGRIGTMKPKRKTSVIAKRSEVEISGKRHLWLDGLRQKNPTKIVITMNAFEERHLYPGVEALSSITSITALGIKDVEARETIDIVRACRSNVPSCHPYWPNVSEEGQRRDQTMSRPWYRSGRKAKAGAVRRIGLGKLAWRLCILLQDFLLILIENA